MSLARRLTLTRPLTTASLGANNIPASSHSAHVVGRIARTPLSPALPSPPPRRCLTLTHTAAATAESTSHKQITNMPNPSITAPLVLTPVQRAYLTFLGSFAAKAASNDMAGVRFDWLRLSSVAAKLGIPQFELERSMLDALSVLHIFVGLPKSIEAYTTCHDARWHDYSKPVAQAAAGYLWPEAADKNWAHPDFSKVPEPCNDDLDSTVIRRARATAALGAIYTTAAPGLEASLKRLHPVFHAGVALHGYGFALCTTALKLFEIEVVAVSVLSGTNTPRQLLSHLRGAVMVGLPQEFITQLLEDVFEEVWQDDGVYHESKEVWRTYQRQLRAKAAKAAGRTLDSAAEEKLARELEFQDQVEQSKKMAQRGQQHPLFTSGQLLGAGDPDEEDHDMKQRPAAAAATPAGAEPAEPTNEEVDVAMRNMMRKRQARMVAEATARPAGSAPADDRWPIPPHVLDPSGTGGMPGGAGGAPGMMGGMGMGMGMGGGPSGMGGFGGMMGGGGPRSRL